MVGQHPGVTHLLNQFRFDHLPDSTREMGYWFHHVACKMVDKGTGIELTVALRKLLEAKDCAERAVREKLEADSQE